jgi:hypothetical protein
MTTVAAAAQEPLRLSSSQRPRPLGRYQPGRRRGLCGSAMSDVRADPMAHEATAVVEAIQERQ